MRDDEALKIISRAWGRKQEDGFAYAFFPWIDRDEQAAAGLRQAGFHEGPAFRWPFDRDKILAHMAAHHDHDLYWCPNLFETEERSGKNHTDEHALWADLDEVDPRDIEDPYKPTTAWETSPGRYQALWVINIGDMQGASWPYGENQQLTYYLGADSAGWDSTQLLRIPGWTNHKIDYVEKYGKAPVGKLLWKNEKDYLPDDFTDLPPVEGTVTLVDEVLFAQVEGVDTARVMARIKFKIHHRIRELLRVRDTSGADRSAVLWDIERSLADAGCTLEEIVALVRNTVWNKFEGRADEFKRLVIEASKAIDRRAKAVVEEDIQAEQVSNIEFPLLDDFLVSIRPPTWLVEGVIAEGSCGFIAGEPKIGKSWVGLDLVMSVASGADFLNHWKIVNPGPVFYIQEEDAPPTVKDRVEKIREHRQIKTIRFTPTEFSWGPDPVPPGIPVSISVQDGWVLSEDMWREKLDQQLDKIQYRLVLIDTLMTVAGAIDENRSQEMMTKFLKPLKQIARKHNTAIILVHHLNKGGNGKGGKRLLGSVANHAWSDNSLYLEYSPSHAIALDVESKFIRPQEFILHGVRSGNASVSATPATTTIGESIVRAIRDQGGATTYQIESATEHTRGALKESLRDLKHDGSIRWQGNQWVLNNGSRDAR